MYEVYYRLMCIFWCMSCWLYRLISIKCPVHTVSKYEYIAYPVKTTQYKVRGEVEPVKPTQYKVRGEVDPIKPTQYKVRGEGDVTVWRGRLWLSPSGVGGPHMHQGGRYNPERGVPHLTILEPHFLSN